MPWDSRRDAGATLMFILFHLCGRDFGVEGVDVGGDQRVAGAQKFVRRERDDQLARFHESDAGAEQQGFAQIVGDKDYRLSAGAAARPEIHVAVRRG